MIEPKPLSEERRREIEAVIASYIEHRNLALMLLETFAAEAFWRERCQQSEAVLKGAKTVLHRFEHDPFPVHPDDMGKV